MTRSLWRDEARSLEIVHDAENRFYEIREDNESAGLLIYEAQGDHYSLTHTYIQEGHRGRGLVTLLVREALCDIRSQGVVVTNRCPVIDRFIEKYPDFSDLVGPLH